jgi:poly(3-hydroxyalkanoate) synthetase
LLCWNDDGTNLPGPMYCWYRRNTCHENDLVKSGTATTCGVQADLRNIAAPRVPGNRTFKAIEAAPGRYVKVKAAA